MGSVQWITRRFWPMAGDQVWHLLHSASLMQQRGWQVEVVTAAWHNSWPAQVMLRELLVSRLAPSPTTPFRSRRYTRALLERLTESASAEQGGKAFPRRLIIEATDDDALAVISHFDAVGPGQPQVIVRYDLVDGVGPLTMRMRTRAVQVCQRASGVVVPHEAARRELIAAGVPASHIQRISDGPWPVIARDLSIRSEARRALSGINYELFLRNDDRLLVCLADLTKGSGVEFVIGAVAPLLQTQRGVRLWIVGDGPERLRLYDLIKRCGWRSDVLMPGTFEDPELLLAAADLCIVPSPSQGCRWLMPTALLSGLPTLCAAGPPIAARLDSCAAPLCFDSGNVHQLQNLIRRWLKDPADYQSATAAAAEHLRGWF